MEHIIKALEQASASVTNRNPPRAEYNVNVDVEYTRTKIIPVDKELLRKKRIINGIDNPILTDAYRLLRTQLLQRMRANNWNTIGITSSRVETEKSLTALNLAISMSMELNQTVLLVDMNLRNPNLHSFINYMPEKGISDYLSGQAELAEIMVNPSVERLVLLPGRDAIQNSSEMLSSPSIISLVNELKSRYSDRYIIFDLPPLLSTDDTLAFSPFIDALLLVIEEGLTKTGDLQRCVDILGREKIIGTVLNKSKS